MPDEHPHDRRQRVEDACAALLAAGQPVTFDEVATRAGIGRATLYRNPTCEPSSKNTAHADEKPTPSPA